MHSPHKALSMMYCSAFSLASVTSQLKQNFILVFHSMHCPQGAVVKTAGAA